MSSEASPEYEGSAVLAKAVENVFRKLVRLLVGRISLVKLQEMISFIYVQETEIKLKADFPGKNVPMAQIALLTGLDSRTVVSIRTKIEESSELYQQRFLQDLTPESAVVEAWADMIKTAPIEKQHEYLTLTYGEKDAEFDLLVKNTISSRGITTQSIIHRLVATGSVLHDREKKSVSLIVKQFSPYLSDDESEIFNAAFLAIASLISTAEVNISQLNGERFFQRQVWTFRLPPSERNAFRVAMKNFLIEVEASARNEMEPWESPESAPGQLSAGMGFYYFEENG